MRITKVDISEFLGIKSLVFEPNKITYITGGNGAGKTSVLEAIKSALGGGGNRASLMRDGSDMSEIILEMDNGDTLTKTLTAADSKVQLKTQGGMRVPGAAGVLKDRISAEVLNPILFLAASEKDQIKMLLRAAPIEMPVAEIMAIANVDITGQDAHPLTVIEQVREKIFDDRTGVNRDIKRLRTLLDSMEKVTGNEDDDPPELDQAGLDALRAEKDYLVQITADREGLENQNLATKTAEIKADAQVKFDAIKEAMALEIEQENKNKEAVLKVVRARATDQMTSFAERIAEAERRLKSKAIMAEALALAASNKKEIDGFEAEKSVLDEQITGLDKFKGELLQNVPIPGLELRDGKIIVDGIKFETLNHAQRIRFAIGVAAMYTPALPVCCVDGMEALDAETFAVFEKEAQASGMQFFITKVSDHEGLKITSE